MPKHNRSRWIRTAALLALLLPARPAAAAEQVIYDDALQSGWLDYGYGGGSDFGNAQPVHGGSLSIAFSGAGGGNAYNAVSFFHATGVDSATWPRLHFWVHGGDAGNQRITLFLQNDDAIVAQAPLDGFIAGGAIATGSWREVTVAIGAGGLGYAGSFDRIDLQSDSDSAQPTLYLDDVALQAGTLPPFFGDGFEGEASAALPALLQEHDVVVQSMASDRFSWRDSRGEPRVAVLAHNDGPAGPGGSRGGELREFRYETAAGTRVVRASGSGASGFGYAVSHPGNAPYCTGGKLDAAYADPYDPNGLLGHLRGGSYSRVFEGRHHAIFRFQTTYPLYCATVDTAPLGYLVPVTIEWLFASGRDDPLWTISWDLGAVPADKLEFDSRAPYGELLFDGSASEGAHSVIAGVAWGDRFRFTTTTTPVTLDADWQWTQPNSIPHVALWTTAVDATMGLVMTQPITRFDVAGYFDVTRFWNHDSADALPNCNGEAGYRMPCADFWPYQSINFSFGGPQQPTNSTRLAWGTEYGFLGQSAYYIHGSSYWGGPLADTTAPGWPKKSYSTFVVLGEHSRDPVGAAVGQMETLQGLQLDASIGSIAASGPAGAGRDDPQAYQPPGYDPLYAALVLVADGNAFDGHLGVAAGTLRHPLIVLRGYAVAQPPAMVRLDGEALRADIDYFASLRADTDELWLTLGRDLAGSGHRLEIQP